MVLQHKYFIQKHYVQVPYAEDANMDLICLSYSLQPLRWTFETHHSWGLWLAIIETKAAEARTKQNNEEKEAKSEQGLAKTTRKLKQPSQNTQKWWAQVWVKNENIDMYRHWNVN